MSDSGYGSDSSGVAESIESYKKGVFPCTWSAGFSLYGDVPERLSVLMANCDILTSKCVIEVRDLIAANHTAYVTKTDHEPLENEEFAYPLIIYQQVDIRTRSGIKHGVIVSIDDSTTTQAPWVQTGDTVLFVALRCDPQFLLPITRRSVLACNELESPTIFEHTFGPKSFCLSLIARLDVAKDTEWKKS